MAGQENVVQNDYQSLITRLLDSIKSKKKLNLIGIVDDPGCDKHKMITVDHKESPSRLTAIREIISECDLIPHMVKVGSITIRKNDLSLCHSKDYIDTLFTCARHNKLIVIPHPSTHISMSDIGSLESILASVASVFGAIDTVCSGCMKNKYDGRYNTQIVKKIFCLTRPPGRNAHYNRGSVDSFMNNTGLGVCFALEKYSDSIKKVLIFDWSRCYCSAAENIFGTKPNVMYMNLHMYDETIIEPEDDCKNIINVPIYPEDTEREYMRKFYDLIAVAYLFSPDLVIINAGFDAHKDEKYELGVTVQPLIGDYTGINGQPDYIHFHEMTKSLMKLADDCSGGRLVSVLETGYDLSVLKQCVAIHLATMISGHD
jgi:acetoin utilization deacetylase AcuC-like enzyme